MCSVFNPLVEDIKRGSGFENGKKRIKEFFLQCKDKKKRIEFLKKEYGVGGWGCFYNGANKVIGDNHDAKGIEVEYNDENCNRVRKLYKWKEVEEVINALIIRGEY